MMTVARLFGNAPRKQRGRVLPSSAAEPSGGTLVSANPFPLTYHKPRLYPVL